MVEDSHGGMCNQFTLFQLQDSCSASEVISRYKLTVYWQDTDEYLIICKEFTTKHLQDTTLFSV